MRQAGFLRRGVAILAAMSVLSGCYEWTARPGAVRAVLTALPVDNRVTMVRADGQVEHLARVRLVGDTLIGLRNGGAWDGDARRIPVDSIATLKEQRFDAPRTATAVAVVLVSGATLFLVTVMALGSMRD